jgi:hypothetical protein
LLHQAEPLRVAVDGFRAPDVRVVIGVPEVYITDVGFYPPDVSRGWDPGLAQPLPYDATDSTQDCNTDQAACVCGQYLACDGGPTLPSNFPVDWIDTAEANWEGPYIAQWPTNTPWGGTYDYNYWPTATVRNGCTVPPGIYLGIESTGGFTLDPQVEQTIFNEGLDNDGCSNNGEVQMLLEPL